MARLESNARRALAVGAIAWIAALGCGDTSLPASQAPVVGQPPVQTSVAPVGQPVAQPAVPMNSSQVAAAAPMSVPVQAPGGLVASTPREQQMLDLFGAPGHRFWLEVSEAQLERMNARQSSVFVGFAVPGMDGDIYTPAGMDATFADRLLIQDVSTGSVADYGKVEVELVGQSTFRTWNLGSIPNLHIDANQFEKGSRIGSFEHIRLNNALVGSIFRETIAHRIYRELGYPALRASYAMLGSNVWGDDVWVPMTLIEVYKRRFCEDNAAALGGDCTNMWEFEGDIGAQGVQGGVAAPEGEALPKNVCQVKDCDNARLLALRDALRKTPRAPGFAAALGELIDWDRFHQFQCLGWIMATGDDALHNGNNTLIVEREDGKLVFAPYSIDISAGQAQYPVVPLLGSTSLPVGCQADPACWSATVQSCEALIAKFDALDPERFVDEAVTALTDLGMMRDGDDTRAAQMRAWLVKRQTDLGAELERYRAIPDVTGTCPEALMLCGDGGCGSADACEQRKCQPGMSFCDVWQRCVFEGSGCPTCEDPAAPVYCAPVSACVASKESCSMAVCANTPGSVYCEPVQSCAMPAECDALMGAGGAGPGRGPTPRM